MPSSTRSGKLSRSVTWHLVIDQQFLQPPHSRCPQGADSVPRTTVANLHLDAGPAMSRPTEERQGRAPALAGTRFGCRESRDPTANLRKLNLSRPVQIWEKAGEAGVCLNERAKNLRRPARRGPLRSRRANPGACCGAAAELTQKLAFRARRAGRLQPCPTLRGGSRLKEAKAPVGGEQSGAISRRGREPPLSVTSSLSSRISSMHASSPDRVQARTPGRRPVQAPDGREAAAAGGGCDCGRWRGRNCWCRRAATTPPGGDEGVKHASRRRSSRSRRSAPRRRLDPLQAPAQPLPTTWGSRIVSIWSSRW